ncbi:MAG: SPOR domain-containing protein [Phycisphaerales bacterium]|nr:SPOR domain-containing protein [Phycisphaerales bacterium]
MAMITNRLLLAILLGSIPVTAGCHSSDGPTIDTALNEYENGSISLAKLDAQEIYQRGGSDAPEAAWVIGLCDYRHGRMVAAREAFQLAASSPSPELSARAKAMIGQTLLEDGQPAAAAIQFEHAWPELRGDDRASCATHAATAWALAGRDDLASEWARKSRLAPTPPTSTLAADQTRTSPARNDDGTFTLQFGAFKKAEGARRAQEQLTGMSNRSGLGAPRIRTRTDRHGGTLYLVQLGSFETRQQAIRASRSLAPDSLMVVTVDTTS